MRILHVSVNSPYTEGWGYQENTLLKVQARMGHEVTLIATCQYYSGDASGRIETTEPCEYYNDDNVRIIRVKNESYFKNKALSKYANRYGFSYHNISSKIEELTPDIIFLHGLGQNLTNLCVFSYVKEHHDSCRLFGDSHSIVENDTFLDIKQRVFFRLVIKPYLKKHYSMYDKFFYLTPACRDFTSTKFGFPKEAMSFLPLGYDPYMCDWQNRNTVRKRIRDKYGISDDEILLVHGGKITKTRKTTNVINAYNKIKDKRVKLLIFGGISSNMQSEMEALLEENPNVTYVGNLTKKEYYDCFLASDIGVFPGGQSVIWQEAIGCGLPVVFGWAEGLEYLDMGGNVKFVDGNSVDSLLSGILALLENDLYISMGAISSTRGREFFSYERIARIACGEDME